MPVGKILNTNKTDILVSQGKCAYASSFDCHILLNARPTGQECDT